MNKNTSLAIVKLIPVISVIVSYILILGPYSDAWVSKVTGVTVILSFLGFVFFFIGRKFAREDRMLKILGILDILSTASIAQKTYRSPQIPFSHKKTAILYRE